MEIKKPDANVTSTFHTPVLPGLCPTAQSTAAKPRAAEGADCAGCFAGQHSSHGHCSTSTHGQNLPNTRKSCNSIKKKKKPLKKRDYFTYSKVFFKNNHGSHFWPFLSARFDSFSTKISWFILQIKRWSVSPKSKDKDEWKFKVAKLSSALEVASFSNMPRQRVMAPEVLCYLVWTMTAAVN